LGLFGVATASVFIPARTLFLPPWRRGEIWYHFPIQMPDPALFEMLEDMQKAADDICGVSECWYHTAQGWNRMVYPSARVHHDDQAGKVLATSRWPRLELPFV